MEVKKRVSIVRCQEAELSKLEDCVTVEQPLSIFLDGQEYQTLACTPAQLQELVFGLLFADGLIRSPEEVIALEMTKARAELWRKETLPPRRRTWLPSGPVFPARELLRCCKDADEWGSLFSQTGGAHYGGIFLGHKLCCYAEDISRKNALAKALGAALLAGLPLSQACLVTSGRVNQEIVRMAVGAETPVLLSRAAPTDLAVATARHCRLTLCGFARGERMNIYAAGERISILEGSDACQPLGTNELD